MLSKRSMVYYYVLLLFLGLANATSAQIPADTLFIKTDGSYHLNEHLYVVEKRENVAVQAIATQEPSANFKKMYPLQALDQGVSKNYYWLVFTLKNSTPTDAVYYFELHYPDVNFAYAYAKTDSTYSLIGKTGIGMPFKVRPYNNYDAVFPISLRAGTATTYLIKVDKLGESLNMRPTLSSSRAFHAEETYQYTFYGLIAGIMLTNLIVNLFLFVSLKQEIHLIYSAYVFAILCWIFDDIAYQFLFPDYPVIPAVSKFVSTGLGLILMSYLIVSFLGLNKQNCRFLKPIVGFRYFMMLLIPVSYLAFVSYGDVIWPKEAYLYIFLIVSCLAILLFLIAAIESAIHKNRMAWFFLLSTAYLAFSIVQYCFYLLGYNKSYRMDIIPSDLQIGVLIETIIIFLGIIYRYNLDKKDKVLLMAKINQQQQETARQIIVAQEGERKRLAQDLHDDVGATLSTLLLHVSNLPAYNGEDKEEALKHHEKSIVISRKALADLRLISHDLLPKDFSNLGIFGILQNKIDELNGFGQINFRLVLAGDDKAIDQIFSITIYRIINELITNVTKHAMASYCNVELIIDKNNLVLIIEDNGTGITLSSSDFGIGLKNIKSRVEFLQGSLSIDGNRKGTSVIIEIPLNQKHGK